MPHVPEAHRAKGSTSLRGVQMTSRLSRHVRHHIPVTFSCGVEFRTFHQESCCFLFRGRGHAFDAYCYRNPFRVELSPMPHLLEAHRAKGSTSLRGVQMTSRLSRRVRHHIPVTFSFGVEFRTFHRESDCFFISYMNPFRVELSPMLHVPDAHQAKGSTSLRGVQMID